MKTFQDKVAVITGGGSGIGRALAVQLARHGTKVAVGGIRQPRVEGTVALIAAAGGEARAYQVDVADRAQVFRLADEVVRDFGKVDILINNAGVAIAPRLFEEITDDNFEWVISTNLWRVYNGIRVFLPYLHTRPEASIVIVSSLAGLVGLMGYAPHVMSKMAVRGLCESLQMELSRTNITVSTVHPGGVKTNLMLSARGFTSEDQRETMDHAFQFAASLTPDKVARQIIRAIKKKKYRITLGVDSWFVNFVKLLFPNRFPDVLHPIFAMAMRPPRLMNKSFLGSVLIQGIY